MIFGKYINRYYLKNAPVLLLGLLALSDDCPGPASGRVFEEAVLEQLGDHLLLQWRGARPQVLQRPPA